eukprot:Gregarina_sp_Poly_1__5628@NODE_296_length_9847_cov_43_256544_g256_i0_p4_GENE_NODE_296_length_9847_cov_43_256544_g256_i0NODE_296_length_9847_cov_43_256544_g256_i0_p4_ORF_typecomplete_len328_score49_78_NODE_296_length_9847_cov_43_256544_g256_i070167999
MEVLNQCIFEFKLQSAETEQVITSITNISRQMVPRDWQAPIEFAIQGLEAMFTKSRPNLNEKEFLAFVLQLMIVQSSRKVGGAQKEFAVLFQNSGLLPLLFATWIQYHAEWIKVHSNPALTEDDDGDEAEERPTTQNPREAEDKMLCLDSILMVTLTYFNGVELLLRCAEGVQLSSEANMLAAKLVEQQPPEEGQKEGDPLIILSTTFSNNINALLVDMKLWNKKRHIAILARLPDMVVQRMSYFVPGKSRIFMDLERSILAPFLDESWSRTGQAYLAENLFRLITMSIVLTTPKYGWTSSIKSSRETLKKGTENAEDQLKVKFFIL